MNICICITESLCCPLDTSIVNQLCVCVLSQFRQVQLFATLWNVGHQAPLSLEFSRQEYQSG